MSVLEIATTTPQLSTLVSLLKAADLVQAVGHLDHATVFAPTNDAFAKLPASTVEYLKSHKKDLQHVLLTHIFPQQAFSQSLRSGGELLMLSGAQVSYESYKGSVFVSTEKSAATVVKADIVAKNNVVIHVINNVLLP